MQFDDNEYKVVNDVFNNMKPFRFEADGDDKAAKTTWEELLKALNLPTTWLPN